MLFQIVRHNSVPSGMQMRRQNLYHTGIFSVHAVYQFLRILIRIIGRILPVPVIDFVPDFHGQLFQGLILLGIKRNVRYQNDGFIAI